MMTKADRENLMKVCRLRAKVAKADVVALAAERRAEFEKQLATIYSFDDDELWTQAMLAATANVPKNLRMSIAQELAKDPGAAWDEALHHLAGQRWLNRP